jgi:signal transduction histidine kinase
MHGGELRIESEKGRGSRVCIILPVARAAAGDGNLH